MEYTVFLTGRPGLPWRATVPWLPDCTVEAPTRAEALEKIKQCISTVVNQIEVLRVQLPDMPQNVNEPLAAIAQTPWQWFGVFQNDPAWGSIFDDIEQQRDKETI